MQYILIIVVILAKDAKEAVAGIILINHKLAMANAYEVFMINKKTIRDTTTAMFLTENGDVRYCTVTNYILHPEFDKDTLNTVALLILEYNEAEYQWKLMDWPDYNYYMRHRQEQVFALGYTDSHKALEQFLYRMDFVNQTFCNEFYMNEKLDSKWMAPTHYQCFRKKYSSEQCVFDSGMALASNQNGKWTLIGMSIVGPGCSLPTRFIDFSYFVPWIEITTKASRRVMPESNIDWPNFDKVILQKLNDSSLVMRPYQGREIIYGKCDKIDGDMMFHEEGDFDVPDRGIGIYGLSIWDKLYHNVTCAMLTVNCVQRSLEPFSFNFGLVQYDEDLEEMVMSIPITKGQEPVGPKIVHLKDGPWLNWWYRPIDGAKVSNVVFRFEFIEQAHLKLEFYGLRRPEPIPDEFSPTKSPNETRSRRPHSYHIRG